MTKIWKSDTSKEELYTRARIINMKDVAPLRVMTGRSLKGVFPKVSLVIESEFPPADFFHSGSLYFIVSETLKDIIEGCASAQAEFYELELRRQGNIYQEKKFYFANLMTQVDCFDYSNAKYTKQGNLIDIISRLAIDESKCGGTGLFRVANLMSIVICAKASLASEIISAGCTGVSFIDPANWKI